MSLDIEEGAEYTDVEQSELDDENEESIQANDATENWKFEYSPSAHDNPSYPDEFVAELHKAAEDNLPDIQQAETNWPFASSIDIPLIKQERREIFSDWAEYDEEMVEEEIEDDQSEENNVNQPCGSTWVSNVGVLNQESVEDYDHCWTGM